MTILRNLIVPPGTGSDHHGISRCLRRALLCAGEFEHRTDRVRDHLRRLRRHERPPAGDPLD